jgi:transcriptional regulator with PAS, ATPase and Fis domain
MFHLPVELQALVDIYDQPFFIIDDSHRVVVVNRAFEKAYRVERDRTAGTHCHQLLANHKGPRPCGSQGHACPFAETFTHQITRTSAYSSQDSEGREHLLRTQAYPIRSESGRVYVGVLMQQDAMRHHPEGHDGACPQSHMVGSSAAWRAALDRLLTAANTDAPVLLQGETGTGKELAAKFIHRHSARHAGPFQTLDCSVLTEELFESEVFGYERGAFTGSIGEKPGLFELGDGGSLFLDEIGEMPLPLQAKLLRVLESGEFRRVGGVKTRRANVRIICATNRTLAGASWFRSDLYYRVACITIRLPSLAERRSDIPLLTSELLDRIGESSGCRYSIDDSAMQLLVGYDFPGNVRELRNILWVAAANALDAHITAVQIAAALPGSTEHSMLTPAEAIQSTATPLPGEGPHGLPPRQLWEADSLAVVLRRHRGNRRAVAQELGVSERTVYRKLRQFGLT